MRKADLRASYKRVWALMKLMGLAFPPSIHRDIDTRGHVAVPAARQGMKLVVTVPCPCTLLKVAVMLMVSLPSATV